MEKFFSSQPKQNLTMGMEFECFLWDNENDGLLQDEKTIRDILNELPKEITRDYYPYQLEVRTGVHKNSESLIKEFIKFLKMSEDVCNKYGVRIIPMSWVGHSEMFCGVHFHFRNGNNNNYEKTMFNVYPFLLALTDCFKHSPQDLNNLTYRFSNSQHCQFPRITEMVRSQRYSDIAVNRHRENTRHRLKSEQTIEMRTFDVPYNIEYLSNLIRLLFKTMQYVNMKEKLCGDISKSNQKLRETRDEIKSFREGYNYFFDKHNYEVYDWLCDKFKIKKLKVPFTMGIEEPYNYIIEKKKKDIYEFLGIKNPKKEVKPKKKVVKTREDIAHTPYGDYASCIDDSGEGEIWREGNGHNTEVAEEMHRMEEA